MYVDERDNSLIPLHDLILANYADVPISEIAVRRKADESEDSNDNREESVIRLFDLIDEENRDE